MVYLERRELLIERARPSLGIKPKAARRRISSRRQLGGKRRSLYARIERRVRDRATPQAREVLRSKEHTRYMRRRAETARHGFMGSRRNKLLRGVTR